MVPDWPHSRYRGCRLHGPTYNHRLQWHPWFSSRTLVTLLSHCRPWYDPIHVIRFAASSLAAAGPERDEISRCRRTNNDRRLFSPRGQWWLGKLWRKFCGTLINRKTCWNYVRVSKSPGAVFLRSTVKLRLIYLLLCWLRANVRSASMRNALLHNLSPREFPISLHKLQTLMNVSVHYTLWSRRIESWFAAPHLKSFNLSVSL